MKKSIFFMALLGVLLTTSFALADTGPLVDGQAPVTDVQYIDETLGTMTFTHVENPNLPHKGWWFVNLTNRTATPWAGSTISAGTGYQVAIVQGVNLVDEWGITGDSVISTVAGTAAYSGSLGTRSYDGGLTTSNLWHQVDYTFASAIGNGGKVGFKVYTDNSYYDGLPADSFQLTITPNPVPEPGSLLALSAGLTGLAGFVIRRRR